MPVERIPLPRKPDLWDNDFLALASQLLERLPMTGFSFNEIGMTAQLLLDVYNTGRRYAAIIGQKDGDPL